MFEPRSLGASGVCVSRFGLGTNALGNLYSEVADADAIDVIDQALEVGITYFDTAPLYGYGCAEQRLGSAVAGKRDPLTISTKVGRLLRADGPAPQVGSILLPRANEPLFKNAPPLNPVFDFTYDATLRSLDDSLDRLAIDRIDVLYIHDPDDHVDAAMRGAYKALVKLKDEGVIGAIGVGSNHTETLIACAGRGDFDAFLVAGRYSLLDQSALEQLMPLCSKREISLVLGGIFNSGILASPDTQPHYDYGTAPPAIQQRVSALRAACTRHGVALAAAAVQFVAANHEIACVLLGPRNREELRADLDFLSVEIPEDLWTEMRNQQLIHPEAPVPSSAQSRTRTGESVP